MWDHAWLLRGVLLLVSLLTLSGLHVQQDQPAVGWSVVRLLPITLCFVSAITTICQLVIVSGDAYQLMYCLCLSTTMVQGTLMLLLLLRHRVRIYAILRDVAALDEATGVCRRPGDYTHVLRMTAFLCIIPVCTFSVWIIGFFASTELEHPNYIIEWYVPSEFQRPPWYGLIIAAQVLFALVVNSYQVAFDVLLSGLADAVTLYQDRLGRYCQNYLSCNDGTRTVRLVHGKSDKVPAILSDAFAGEAIKTADVQGGIQRAKYIQLPKLRRVGVWSTDGAIRTTEPRHGLSEPPLQEMDAGQPAPELWEEKEEAVPDLEFRLQQLTETYASVRRLASDAAALCSLPTLSQHACVTTGLLLGSYLIILMEGTIMSDTVHMISFITFAVGMVLRVLMVNCAGSRLIQQGERLHQTLAGVRWPVQVPAADRFSLQLLLEQTRQPLAFDAWGLFTVQKSNMLALFSFVLTYFVILIQMRVG